MPDIRLWNASAQFKRHNSGQWQWDDARAIAGQFDLRPQEVFGVAAYLMGQIRWMPLGRKRSAKRDSGDVKGPLDTVVSHPSGAGTWDARRCFER